MPARDGGSSRSVVERPPAEEVVAGVSSPRAGCAGRHAKAHGRESRISKCRSGLDRPPGSRARSGKHHARDPRPCPLARCSDSLRPSAGNAALPRPSDPLAQAPVGVLPPRVLCFGWGHQELAPAGVEARAGEARSGRSALWCRTEGKVEPQAGCARGVRLRRRAGLVEACRSATHAAAAAIAHAFRRHTGQASGSRRRQIPWSTGRARRGRAACRELNGAPGRRDESEKAQSTRHRLGMPSALGIDAEHGAREASPRWIFSSSS